jgi:hypothetical protein
MKLAEHTAFVVERLEDMPEVRDWTPGTRQTTAERRHSL